jgi:hypothetical protein
VFAFATVLRAFANFQAIGASVVAVAAAPAAGSTIVDMQLDLAERAVALDHHSNCALRFILERRGHS